jgi:hypothetical protein
MIISEFLGRILNTLGVQTCTISHYFTVNYAYKPCLQLFYWCRLLTVGLQSSEGVTWAEALQSEHNLTHILWIAENSLNPHLIEKVTEIIWIPYITTFYSSCEIVWLFSFISLQFPPGACEYTNNSARKTTITLQFTSPVRL